MSTKNEKGDSGFDQEKVPEIQPPIFTRLQVVNNLSSDPTAIEVICGPGRFVYSERKNLIRISKFFEAMINLKPEEDAVIDISSFCANEQTLSTLIHYANNKSVIGLNFNISTVANLIFLTEPLQLHSALKVELIQYLYRTFEDDDHVKYLMRSIETINTTRLPAEFEIESILKFFDM